MGPGPAEALVLVGSSRKTSISFFLAALGLSCCMGFLELQWVGAPLCCAAQASH